MRVPLEINTITTAQALAQNGITQFSSIFPLSGEGWDTLRLSFNNTIGGSGGTGAYVYGGFGIVKNVELKTSKGELVCSSPGMGLLQYALLCNHAESFYELISATNGTYRNVIDIPFAPGSYMLNRLEDLYLDSGQYTNVELQIQYGAVADLFGTVGSSTLTAQTVDISLLRTKAALDDPKTVAGRKSQVAYVPFIRHYPTINPSSQPYIILEAAQDLYITGMIGYGQTGNSGLVPYSMGGTAAWNVKNVTFRDNVTRWLNNVPVAAFAQQARMLFEPPNQAITNTLSMVGYYPWQFVRDWSIREAYWTGNKSEIRLEWTFDTGANPSFDLLVFGYRKLRR